MTNQSKGAPEDSLFRQFEYKNQDRSNVQTSDINSIKELIRRAKMGFFAELNSSFGPSRTISARIVALSLSPNRQFSGVWDATIQYTLNCLHLVPSKRRGLIAHRTVQEY